MLLQSHVAMQSSLPHNLVPIGTSTLLMIISTSCAIFMAVGQAVFQTRLEVNLGKILPADVVDAIISSGATEISSLVGQAELSSVFEQYSVSVTEVFVCPNSTPFGNYIHIFISNDNNQYIPAVSPVISFILIAGCKWISTKSKQIKNADSGKKESV